MRAAIQIKPGLLIVGLGMATMKLLDEMVALNAHKRFNIQVLSAESEAGYNRILLSHLLAGQQSLAQITTHDQAWFDQHGISVHFSQKVVQLNTQKKRVITESAGVFKYDKLVLATGSQPIRLPIEGASAKNLLTFRDVKDVQHLLTIPLQNAAPVVVVGGGLLGLEAAYGLVKQGHQVTVLHRSDRILSQQLDSEAGRMLQIQLESMGIRFRLHAQLAVIQGEQNVNGVILDDGTHLQAKAVVMAVGIQPNIELAQRSGLLCKQGVLVDQQMQTSQADIFALGECVEFDGHTYGLVAPIYRQAKVLAQNLFEPQSAVFANQISPTQLKVSGIHVVSFGWPVPTDANAQTLVYQDKKQGVYRKVVLLGGRVHSAVLLGQIQDAQWLFNLYLQQTIISAHQRQALVLGQAYYERKVA